MTVIENLKQLRALMKERNMDVIHDSNIRFS